MYTYDATTVTYGDRGVTAPREKKIQLAQPQSMYTRAGGGEERERGGTGRGPNVKSDLLDAFGLEDVLAVNSIQP